MVPRNDSRRQVSLVSFRQHPDECEEASEKREILTNLYELIEALNRRVPRLARVGQLQIAHDPVELESPPMTQDTVVIPDAEADGVSDAVSRVTTHPRGRSRPGPKM